VGIVKSSTQKKLTVHQELSLAVSASQFGCRKTLNTEASERSVADEFLIPAVRVPQGGRAGDQNWNSGPKRILLLANPPATGLS
jgi:hypothetical protein